MVKIMTILLFLVLLISGVIAFAFRKGAIKGLLVGLVTFIVGFIISFISTGLASNGGEAAHVGVAIMTAIIYLSAIIATCTTLIIKNVKCNKNLG